MLKENLQFEMHCFIQSVQDGASIRISP